ncbi:uncharacterized protein LOC100186708 isoform X1 [Ciona intestinalis]
MIAFARLPSECGLDRPLSVGNSIKLLLQFLTISLMVTSSLQHEEVGLLSRFRRSDSGLTCLEALNRCKNSSNCGSAFRAVKKKCKITGARCNAPISDQPKCAENIDILRSTYFPLDDKCKCYAVGLVGKKLKRCQEIRNSVYANPCFESGRLVAAKLAMTTQQVTSTHYITGYADVTGRFDFSEINHSGVTMPTDYRPPDVTKPAGDVILESQSQFELLTSSVSDTTLSETELDEIDEFLIDDEGPPDDKDANIDNRSSAGGGAETRNAEAAPNIPVVREEMIVTEGNTADVERDFGSQTSVAVQNTKTSYVVETYTVSSPNNWQIALIACGPSLMVLGLIAIIYLLHQRRSKSNYSVGKQAGNSHNLTVSVPDDEIKLSSHEDQV